MASVAMSNSNPLLNLNREYLRLYPIEAARVLETMAPAEIAGIMKGQSVPVIANVFEKFNPSVAEHVLLELSPKTSGELLEALSIRTCMSVLSRLSKEEAKQVLQSLSVSMQAELSALLEYPEDVAGRLMNPRVSAVNEAASVKDVMQQMQRKLLPKNRIVYLINDGMQLVAQVNTFDLMFADPDSTLISLSKPVTQFLQDIDPREDVLKKLESSKKESLPVLNADLQVMGMIEGLGLLDVLKEDIGIDMQTMVGASKDERALSSAFFAVKKRLPWLQINLLTAFMAASVVSMFEGTIAQFTALAILMPIAAGQSGNTGAQALAVTMRGLTLREISIRDWFRVMRKEIAAGMINGFGVAIVCSIGVYLWSRSLGLALVMASAMIISMTIAGLSGALVPMLLKRLGLDPAQSSSIVLTTVTDITGFVSFLGIATLMASMI